MVDDVARFGPVETGLTGGIPWALYTLPEDKHAPEHLLVVEPGTGFARWGRTVLAVGSPGGAPLPVFESEALARVCRRPSMGWDTGESRYLVYRAQLTDAMCRALALGGMEFARVGGAVKLSESSMWLGGDAIFDAHETEHIDSVLFASVDPLISWLSVAVMSKFSYLSPELALSLVSSRYERVLAGGSRTVISTEADLACALVSPITGGDDTWYAGRFGVGDSHPLGDTAWWYAYRAAAAYVGDRGGVVDVPEWVRVDPTVSSCPSSCPGSWPAVMFDGSTSGAELSVAGFEFFTPAAGFVPAPIDITGLSSERARELESFLVVLLTGRCFELDDTMRRELDAVNDSELLRVAPLLLGPHLAFAPLPAGFFDVLAARMDSLGAGRALRGAGERWDVVLPGVSVARFDEGECYQYESSPVPVARIVGVDLLALLPVDERTGFGVDAGRVLADAGVDRLSQSEIIVMVWSCYLDDVASLLAEYPVERDGVGGELSLCWYLNLNGVPTA